MGSFKSHIVMLTSIKFQFFITESLSFTANLSVGKFFIIHKYTIRFAAQNQNGK